MPRVFIACRFSSLRALICVSRWGRRITARAERADIGHAADDARLQPEAHRNFVALAANTPLSPGKHLIDELPRVAMGARPCTDRNAAAGEFLPYRIGLGPGYACIHGGTQKFTFVNIEFLLVYSTGFGKPGRLELELWQATQGG